MTTIVTRGRGKGIVVRTGLSTEIGRISAAITNVPDVPSSIQKKLDSLGKILVVTCLTLVIIIIAIAIGWIASKGAVSGKDWRHVLEVGISLGVSVIPEGLVAVVTVVQALGVSRMAAKNAIVRKAAAVEAVGSVTFICSDKVF
jgi:Ca2+-transporting ATPase